MAKFHISDFIAHEKALNEKEANLLSRSRWKVIIKLMDEIKIIETKRAMQKSRKQRADSLRKLRILTKPYSN